MSASPTFSVKPPGRWTQRDFDLGPMLVFYELTRACDLVCLHCRACAQPKPDPNELTTAQSKLLIDQLTQFPQPPMLVLTGGDPLKRTDIYELISYSVESGLDTSITPSPTPLVTPAAVRRLKDAGIHRMAVSIDGADPETHDSLRGVAGSFDHTKSIMAAARDCGIPIQVNTTLSPRNYDQIEAMADMLAGEQILLWSVFFIVPVGRATADLRLSAEKQEAAFERLYLQTQRQPYGIKTTEAMHFRRFLAQQRKRSNRAKQLARHDGAPKPRYLTLGINDGKGTMFVGCAGLIHPSGFLPMICGMFPFNSVVDVYQNSPVFRRLREPNQYLGKCGVCEFRHLCGGSRARAFSVTGNPYESEPDCAYDPPEWIKLQALNESNT